ncbi:MAG: hypothetical protein R3F60_06090 [bacterium]
MSEEQSVDSPVERYFDGRMSPAEARAFEAELDASPALFAELSALQHTRDALQGWVGEHVDAADFSGFFAAIQAALPVREEPAVAAPAAPPTTAERLRAWWARYWTPVLVSTAAAAGVAFLVTRLATPAVDVDDGDVAVAGGAVVVDEVNNDGPKTVLISMPVDDDEESSTVIWLLDEDDAAAGDSPADGEDPI